MSEIDWESLGIWSRRCCDWWLWRCGVDL